MAKFGCHIQFKGTLEETYKSLNLSASQIYLPQRGLAYPDIIESRRCCTGSYKCIHSCLASNLAGSTDGTLDSKYKYKLTTARSKLLKELDIAAVSGADVVVHSGVSKDHYRGLLTVGESLNYVLTKETPTCEYFRDLYDVKSQRHVVLENAAGETSKLGSTFDELKFIMGIVPENLRKQVFVCIDTAHIFASGLYDMGRLPHVHQFFQDFGNTFGKDKLKVIHLNDSKIPFDGHKDQHEVLTKGYVFGKDGGEFALKEFVKICGDIHVPLISETPDAYFDISLIRSLVD